MKKLLIITLVLQVGLAQGQDIIGKIKDGNEGLVGATAMLLNASDSVISSFAISDSKGDFTIKKAFNGEYLLQINFVGFKTHSQKITVKGQDIRLNDIQLEADLLDELVVEAERVPIEMKKDTIEYNAAAFKTQPNAVVEDLLKKLPGVEVDRDGTIQAQGEDVNKVLVDGKEFFGDDPQMATKNLAADAVDKIQVFDKKSEFSEFSGIDDGNEQKTINIALKDDRKQGTFGKVGAGGGTDETYRMDANVNQFRKDNQFSIIAKNNNINEQGFSVGDYISFMGGMSNLGGGRGGFSINSSIPIGDDVSNGFVTTAVTGLNFNRDFSEKSELQSNYLFSRINNIQDITTRTNFLDGSQDIDQSSKSESTANMHQVNLNYKQKLTEKSDIQIKNRVSYNEGESNGESTSTIELRDTENVSNVTSSSSDALNLNSRLIFRQRFTKPGRTMVAEGRVTRNKNDATGSNFRDSDIDENDLDQMTTTDNHATTFGTEISFTEPIGTSKYLEVRYEYQKTRDEDSRKVYDIDNEVRTLNDLQSQLYVRDYNTNTAGLSFNYVKEKFKFTAGSNFQYGELVGEVVGDTPLNRDFNAGLPYMRSSYDFTNSMRISFNYNTRQQIPSVRQLQPVLDLTNPSNQYIGNDDLDASYVHTAMVHFNVFDQFTSKSFFTMIRATLTEQNIVTSRETILNGRGILSTPVNSGNALTLTNYASFSGRIRFAKLKYNLSNRLSRNTGNTLNNDLTFQTRQITNTVSVSLENAKKEKVDWIIGVRVTSNDTKSEDAATANQNLSNTAYFNDMTWYFAKKWSFTSNFDVTKYSNEGIGGGNEVALWQTSIQRDFLKNDRGQFKFSVFDMLNQNLGINQTANTLLIREQRIQSLGRYFMLGLTYKLSNYESKGTTFKVKRR